MKKWTGNINIDAPIDVVWQFIDGPLEDMQKVMPTIIDNKVIRKTRNGVGTIHRQKFQDGKKVHEYDVETLEYENEPKEKKQTVAFNLGSIFKITTTYEVGYLEENKTFFRYTTSNEPLKWTGRILMVLGGKSDKLVIYFINRVKQAAEEKFNNE